MVIKKEGFFAVIKDHLPLDLYRADWDVKHLRELQKIKAKVDTAYDAQTPEGAKESLLYRTGIQLQKSILNGGQSIRQPFNPFSDMTWYLNALRDRGMIVQIHGTTLIIKLP